MICPNCENEVFSKTKYCEHCGKNLEGDVIIKEENSSFIKHLFNWKFYIAPILFSIVFAFLYHSRGEHNKGVALIIFILVIIMTVKYKSSFIKKFAMFICSYIGIGTISALNMVLFISIFTSLLGQSNALFITDNILSQNKHLPMMLNSYIERMRFEKNNNNSITSNLRFVNFTKDEVINNFSNQVTLFEEHMLKEELILSCNATILRNILEKDIQYNMNFFDKNQQYIGMIYLNKQRCIPFIQ